MRTKRALAKLRSALGRQGIATTSALLASDHQHQRRRTRPHSTRRLDLVEQPRRRKDRCLCGSRIITPDPVSNPPATLAVIALSTPIIALQSRDTSNSRRKCPSCNPRSQNLPLPTQSPPGCPEGRQALAAVRPLDLARSSPSRPTVTAQQASCTSQTRSRLGKSQTPSPDFTSTPPNGILTPASRPTALHPLGKVDGEAALEHVRASTIRPPATRSRSSSPPSLPRDQSARSPGSRTPRTSLHTTRRWRRDSPDR